MDSVFTEGNQMKRFECVVRTQKGTVFSCEVKADDGTQARQLARDKAEDAGFRIVKTIKVKPLKGKR